MVSAGVGGWQGRFCEGSTQLTELRRTQPKLVAVEQAGNNSSDAERVSELFWMEWGEFRRHFWEVGVCDPWSLSSAPITDGSRMPVTLMVAEGRWVAGCSAGGMVESVATFDCNPSWELICDSSSSSGDVDNIDVHVTMYQDDIRSLHLATEVETAADGLPSAANFQPMSLFLLPPRSGGYEGGRVAQAKELLALSVNKRQLSSTLSLRSGQQYTLVGATWAPSVAGRFWISVCGGSSGARVQLRCVCFEVWQGIPALSSCTDAQLCCRALPPPLVSTETKAAMSSPWFHGRYERSPIYPTETRNTYTSFWWI